MERIAGSRLQETLAFEMQCVEKEFTHLRLYSRNGGFSVEGRLNFTAQYDEIEIADVYDIEVVIAREYPHIIPCVWEVGGRIPHTKEYHTFNKGQLCLGARALVRMKFAKDPSLVSFIKSLVIPFLYATSFRERKGKYPWGEYDHIGFGILQSYCEVFAVESEVSVMRLLELLATDVQLVGHRQCPCGHKTKLKNCHGAKLKELKLYGKPHEYFQDAWDICLAKCVVQDIKPEVIEITRRVYQYAKKKYPACARNLQGEIPLMNQAYLDE